MKQEPCKLILFYSVSGSKNFKSNTILLSNIQIQALIPWNLWHLKTFLIVDLVHYSLASFFSPECKLYAGLPMSTDSLVRMWMYASQELRGGTGIQNGDELSRLAPEIDGEFKVDREWVWVDLDAGGRGTSGARTVRREGASLKMSPPCFSFLKMKILLGTILFLVKLRWGSSLVYIFYPTKDLLRVRIIWQCVQHDHVILSLC